MRWDHLIHATVGFALVLGFSVIGHSNPRLTAPLCISAAVGREAMQNPRNDGWEQMRDAGYTFAGCGIAAVVWKRHAARDAKRDTLLINARLRLLSFEWMDKAFKEDSARRDSIAKAKRNSMKIAER